MQFSKLTKLTDNMLKFAFHLKFAHLKVKIIIIAMTSYFLSIQQFSFLVCNEHYSLMWALQWLETFSFLSSVVT